MVWRSKMTSLSLLSFFLVGCAGRDYLTLLQDRVDAQFLASTHVGTPDPRQAHPPEGQRIIIEWNLPRTLFEQDPHIDLHLLFWNNTQEVISYPLTQADGTQVYYLLGDAFKEKKGILTYKADLVAADGAQLCEWRHQLWVNLINIEPESLTLPESSPDAHLNPIEEIYEEEEMSDEFFYPPPSDMERDELPPVEPGEVSPQQHEMDEQS